jgi:ribonuclease P protein component
MRLSGPSQYGPVFKNGTHTGGGGLTVLFVKNSVGHPRLGLAIAKKHIKFATGRNKIKRIIRASFQARQSQLGSVDVVVLSRKEITKRSAAQLQSTLDKHWQTVITQWEK